MTLTPAQKAEGWIEWKGGMCPIADHLTTVRIISRDGVVIDHDKRGRGLRWEHRGWGTDIIAYRLIEAHGADAEQATEGTLVEIGARVGDTVCPTGGPNFVVTCDHPDAFTGRDGRGYNGPLNMLLKWRIVSRAAAKESEPARPTPFPRDYSELLFGDAGWSQTIIVDGKRPEWLRDDDQYVSFTDTEDGWTANQLDGEIAIRVRRREPKRETVDARLEWKKPDGSAERVCATIDLIDGKPDLSTLKIGSA